MIILCLNSQTQPVFTAYYGYIDNIDDTPLNNINTLTSVTSVMTTIFTRLYTYSSTQLTRNFTVSASSVGGTDTPNKTNMLIISFAESVQSEPKRISIKSGTVIDLYPYSPETLIQGATYGYNNNNIIVTNIVKSYVNKELVVNNTNLNQGFDPSFGTEKLLTLTSGTLSLYINEDERLQICDLNSPYSGYIGFNDASNNNSLPNTIINSSNTAIAIGYKAGANTQGTNAIAIGQRAGQTSQGTNAIAIGQNAGANAQSTNAIAIGQSAGANAQSSNAIAIG